MDKFCRLAAHRAMGKDSVLCGDVDLVTDLVHLIWIEILDNELPDLVEHKVDAALDQRIFRDESLPLLGQLLCELIASP